MPSPQFQFAIGRPSVAAAAGNFIVPDSISRPSGVTDATNHPASNLSVEKLSRTWRSDSASVDQSVLYDLAATGPPVSPAAVFVEGANVPSITVESSVTDDGSAVYSEDFTLVQSDVSGRYCGVCMIEGALPQRYWRFKIAGSTTTTPSAAYFQVARVSWIGTLSTMAQNWGLPYEVRPARYGGHLDSPDGSLDSTDLSQAYAVLSLTGAFAQNRGDSIVAQLRAMQSMSFADRILMFENKDDISRAWLCARVGDMAVVREQFATVRADLVLREVL